MSDQGLPVNEQSHVKSERQALASLSCDNILVESITHFLSRDLDQKLQRLFKVKEDLS